MYTTWMTTSYSFVYDATHTWHQLPPVIFHIAVSSYINQLIGQCDWLIRSLHYYTNNKHTTDISTACVCVYVTQPLDGHNHNWLTLNMPNKSIRMLYISAAHAHIHRSICHHYFRCFEYIKMITMAQSSVKTNSSAGSVRWCIVTNSHAHNTHVQLVPANKFKHVRVPTDAAWWNVAAARPTSCRTWPARTLVFRILTSETHTKSKSMRVLLLVALRLRTRV